MKNLEWLFALCVLVPLSAHAQGAPRDYSEGMRRFDTESHRYLVKVYAVQNAEKPLESLGHGSGELIRSAGGVVRILTNAHVVGSAATVMIQFDKERFAQEVTVLGVDKLVDLALLEAPRPLPASADPIKISKRSAKIGDVVYAGGYPYGSRNITFGFVTSLSSPASELFFSHQTPIAPGNSGGALVRFTDTGEQELVGINTAVLTHAVSENTRMVGLGMSIKTAVIERMIGKLESERFVNHAFIGLKLEDSERANPYFLRTVSGAYPPARPGIVVSNIAKDSPASRAGIAPGDMIRKFEVLLEDQWLEMPISSAELLSGTIFFDIAPGTRVRVLTSRGGQEIGREMTLETYPEGHAASPRS